MVVQSSFKGFFLLFLHQHIVFDMDKNHPFTSFSSTSDIETMIDLICETCQHISDPQERQKVLVDMIKVQWKGRRSMVERLMIAEAQIPSLRRLLIDKTSTPDVSQPFSTSSISSRTGLLIDIIRKICHLVPDLQEQETLIDMIKDQLRDRDQILERAIPSKTSSPNALTNVRISYSIGSKHVKLEKYTSQ